MLPRKAMLLAASTVLIVGIVFVARNLMGPDEPPPVQAPTTPVTEIAEAVHDLPTGTILKESDLKWADWPQGADTSAFFVKGATDNLSDLTGAVVREGFRSGEPIMPARIAHPHDQGFLAAVLTPGMRAMSISISQTAGVAGFIFPGDRVDVILTHSFMRKDTADLSDGRRVSEVILQDVRVLALDQRSSNQSTDPVVANTATLEVSQKQAEKLAMAVDMASPSSSSKGALSLVLRSLASEDAIPDPKPTPTWDSDVSPAYPTVNGDDGLTQRVQIIRGKTITNQTFERH